MSEKKTKKTVPAEAPTPEAKTSTTTTAKRLTKSSTDKMVCGVCGGLGEYLSLDPVILRLLFVILTISGGSGILIYIVLCIVLPEQGSAAKSTQEVVKENTQNLETTIEDAAANVEKLAMKKNTQTWLGLGVIVLGALLLANNFGYLVFADIARLFVRTLWPIVIIALGIIILTRSKNGK